MTKRVKHINYIINNIKKNSSVSVDDLVRLAKMNDSETQNKYLQLKYGQNDSK